MASSVLSNSPPVICDMKTAVVLGLAIALVGVQANDDVPKETVKAALFAIMENIKVAPIKIELLEKFWDGSLPDTVDKNTFLGFGLNDQQAQTILEYVDNAVKNKDNPSWKVYYGSFFYEVLGADKAANDMFGNLTPDHIPKNFNEGVELGKKVGFNDELAKGTAAIFTWLRNLKVIV